MLLGWFTPRAIYPLKLEEGYPEHGLGRRTKPCSKRSSQLSLLIQLNP